MKSVGRMAPTQEDHEARDAEEMRRDLERAGKEQVQREAEARTAYLEGLRRGASTEAQRQARQNLRDVHTVVAGRWEIRTSDAWSLRFSELAKDATAVAEAAVREWAAGPLAEAEAELKAADAARDAYIRGQGVV